ncbi:hypothetical protein RI129_008220 [Pyrocoelia pectoralis]|uniref:UDP-glucuronosyltransferase n=1 Tax=Pyrocoelia pectoralis TaxID=417401 RepID=A0AAN7ZK21_9COLE
MKIATFKIFYFLWILCTFICLTDGARILGVFQMPSYSHYQLGDRILKELAARGHEVTLISPYKQMEQTKNFRTIVIENAFEVLERNVVDLFSMSTDNMLSTNLQFDTRFLPYTENTLNSSNVQKLIKSNEKFDIVILERLMNDAFHGFCAHFEAHCIISSPIPTSSWTNIQMGNAGPPSYVPELSSQFSSKMNFFERAYNFLGYLFYTTWFHAFMVPLHNEVMHKYFTNVPHFYDVYYNVSLMLINTHTAVHPPVPRLPNMIEIGGYHIKSPKPIPKDLKAYLDNAKEGVILFSMGSNLRSKDLPNDKRRAILNSFSKLKEKILWKWENESMSDLPGNVKLSKWLPQNDVLAHPNVKLFVTHGGLLSTLEAIYHGIPLVGIPVYGDQYSNMRIAEDYGYGISVPYEYLNEEGLTAALEQGLKNPTFSDVAKRRSKIMHDDQLKPLDKAIFWIEYILRHNGGKHLKSSSLSFNILQYLLLDVIGFISIIIAISICVCIFALKKIRRPHKKVTISKKKN